MISHELHYQKSGKKTRSFVDLKVYVLKSFPPDRLGIDYVFGESSSNIASLTLYSNIYSNFLRLSLSFVRI